MLCYVCVLCGTDLGYASRSRFTYDLGEVDL